MQSVKYIPICFWCLCFTVEVKALKRWYSTRLHGVISQEISLCTKRDIY